MREKEEMERQRQLELERQREQERERQGYHQENYNKERFAKSDIYHHDVGVGGNEPNYQSNYQPRSQS